MENQVDRFYPYDSIIKFEKVGPEHAKIHFSYDGIGKDTIAYMHQLQGVLETLIEMANGKNGKVNLTAKHWEGSPESVFDITWQ